MARVSPNGSIATRSFPGGAAAIRQCPAGALAKRVFPVEVVAGHGEEGDEFTGLLEGSDALVAWWSPNAAEAGDLADGATAMESMFDTNPDMKIKTASTGNWKLVADNPGGDGAPDSLKSAVCAEVQAKTDYCSLDNAVSLSTALAAVLNDSPQDTTISGFVFFKMKDTSPDFSYQDILQFSGLLDTGTGSDNANTMFLGTWAGDDVYLGGIKQNVGQMATSLVHSVWYYIAFLTDGSNATAYQVKADGSEDWGDVVTMTNTDNGTYIPRDGLSMGRNSSHGAQANADVCWGPIGLFNTGIGVGEEGTSLRTIFESAISYLG